MNHPHIIFQSALPTPRSLHQEATLHHRAKAYTLTLCQPASSHNQKAKREQKTKGRQRRGKRQRYSPPSSLPPKTPERKLSSPYANLPPTSFLRSLHRKLFPSIILPVHTSSTRLHIPAYPSSHAFDLLLPSVRSDSSRNPVNLFPLNGYRSPSLLFPNTRAPNIPAPSHHPLPCPSLL